MRSLTRAIPRQRRNFWGSAATSSPTSPLKESYGLFINGEEVDSEGGEFIDVEDPARGITITKVAAGTTKDMEKAIASAKEAFEDGR